MLGPNGVGPLNGRRELLEAMPRLFSGDGMLREAFEHAFHCSNLLQRHLSVAKMARVPLNLEGWEISF